MEDRNTRGRGRREKGGIGAGKAEDKVGTEMRIGPAGSGDLMTLTTMVMLTIEAIGIMRLKLGETGQLISLKLKRQKM